MRVGVTGAARREIRLAIGVDPVLELGLEEFNADDPEDPPIVVCVRVPAPHVAGARQERCNRCRHKIWVAPSSPKAGERVCLSCFAAAAEQLRF